MITDEFKYDDSTCQCLFSKLSLEKLCVIVVYRPPDADFHSFNKVIRFIRCNLDDVDEDFQKIIAGDLNFPSIDWSQQRVLCRQGMNTQRSAGLFLELLSSNLLTQYVDQPTRGNNILDLFCTNDPYLVQSVNVNNTGISDHKLVQICIAIDSRISISFTSNNEPGSIFKAVNRNFGHLFVLITFRKIN